MSARQQRGSEAEVETNGITDRGRAATPVGFVGSLVQGGPWAVRDALTLGSRWAAGLIGMAASFMGVNWTDDWRSQLLWIVAGAGSVVWIYVANAGWLLAGVGAVGRERSLLRTFIRDAELQRREKASAAHAGSASCVTGEGMRRFHLATCQLAMDKAVVAIDTEAAAARALEPCGVCLT